VRAVRPGVELACDARRRPGNLLCIRGDQGDPPCLPYSASVALDSPAVSSPSISVDLRRDQLAGVGQHSCARA
jgi:hypothetical protein